MFSKKTTKIDEIFTVDLTVCSKCRIDGEDFVKFSGLLRKHELYKIWRLPERILALRLPYPVYLSKLSKSAKV